MVTILDFGTYATIEFTDGSPTVFIPKNTAEVRLDIEDRITVRVPDEGVYNFPAAEVVAPVAASPLLLTQEIAEILNVPVSVASGATEATQLDVLTELQTINTDIDNLNLETTQQSILTELQNINISIGTGTQIDFKQRVIAGLVPGWEYRSANGLHQGVTNGLEEFMWAEHIPKTWLTTATATPLQLSSTSNNDTNGGTGAWVIMVMGLDANYNKVMEFVTMNGQTAVPTVNTYTRVYYLHATQAGTLRTNDGTIYIGSGTVTAGVNSIPEEIMGAGKGKGSSTIIHVPANHVFIMENASLGITTTGTGSTRASKLTVRIRRDYPGVNGVTCRHYEVILRDTVHLSGICPTLKLVGPAAAYCTVEGFANDADAIATALIEGYLYDTTI